jgi:hypothetical protein
LVNLELSENKYDLINRLKELSPGGLDDLDEVLKDWSVGYAKILLDEIGSRLSLLKQLEQVLYSGKADEVHELQPLFERGLWIFGPEFESIEYTSNKGMTKVIHDLFGDKTKASLNRPDFVILPDSSIGLYACPSFNENFEENGFSKVVIIELKAPGLKLGQTEINQPERYANELYSKGVLRRKLSKVICFIIGETIEDGWDGERTVRDGDIIIQPMLYDLVIRKAKRRLFNLYDKLKAAPFITDIDTSYTKEIEEAKQELF